MTRPGAIAGGVLLFVAALAGVAIPLERETRRRGAELDGIVDAYHGDRATRRMEAFFYAQPRSWLARIWPPYGRKLAAIDGRLPFASPFSLHGHDKDRWPPLDYGQEDGR